MSSLVQNALVTLSFLLVSCSPQELCRIEIQGKLDRKVVVTEVKGIGFDPFPDPSAPTDANVLGTVGKTYASHSAPARIIVHDSPTLTYRDSEGKIHRPTVKIINQRPGQKDFGYVRILLNTPDEVLVFAGEMEN